MGEENESEAMINLVKQLLFGSVLAYAVSFILNLLSEDMVCCV